MPFRIATFLAASALGGGLATALLNWHYAWLGAWQLDLRQQSWNRLRK